MYTIYSYIASIPENLEPGSVIMFPEQYSTRVHDEDIGKAGVFALKLQNNNGTFEINPTVAEKTADFILMVRDNTLIDYEMYESLSFKVCIPNAKIMENEKNNSFLLFELYCIIFLSYKATIISLIHVNICLLCINKMI